ncbi:MAG: hypothetical protein Q7S13_02350, partial [Candidatus Omnitrophota bacterium]|nr:hypothetical protein [Candidatus Omnitrophota bacterium]
RLGAHIAAAAVIACNSEFFVGKIPFPWGGDISLNGLAIPFTILYLLWMTNLYNFMDGMDGLAGGMTIIGFSVLGYFAWNAGDQTLAIAASTVVAATGAFLVFNFPPSKIFLGDAGSIPLGFLAGALSLRAIHNQIIDFWAACIIFSPFIADATITLFTRIICREKFWHPHRKHFYQRLVLMGWSHQKTALAEYIIMMISGFTAFFYIRSSQSAKFALLLGCFFVYALFFLCIRVLRNPRMEKQS